MGMCKQKGGEDNKSPSSCNTKWTAFAPLARFSSSVYNVMAVAGVGNGWSYYVS
jgi:hypothetical protein